MVQRLSEGVPSDIASRAAGIDWETVKDKPEIDRAVAEGEIALFERARDSGVTGTIRAAQRYETKSWATKAEPMTGATLEELLKD